MLGQALQLETAHQFVVLLAPVPPQRAQLCLAWVGELGHCRFAIWCRVGLVFGLGFGCPRNASFH